MLYKIKYAVILYPVLFDKCLLQSALVARSSALVTRRRINHENTDEDGHFDAMMDDPNYKIVGADG